MAASEPMTPEALEKVRVLFNKLSNLPLAMNGAQENAFNQTMQAGLVLLAEVNRLHQEVEMLNKALRSMGDQALRLEQGWLAADARSKPKG